VLNEHFSRSDRSSRIWGTQSASGEGDLLTEISRVRTLFLSAKRSDRWDAFSDFSSPIWVNIASKLVLSSSCFLFWDWLKDLKLANITSWAFFITSITIQNSSAESEVGDDNSGLTGLVAALSTNLSRSIGAQCQVRFVSMGRQSKLQGS